MSRYQESFSAMGGDFIYSTFAQPFLSQKKVSELFTTAHQEVLRIENKYTEFKESEIEKINALAGIGPYNIDEETLYLLDQSKKFYQLSQGIFDITYSSRNKLWREQEKKISLVDKIKLKSLVNFNKVIINSASKTISLPSKGMRIGFGGIGKGYAVDRAFEFLKKEGLINFSVNGSGDMRVHSHGSAPRAWKIGIRNPFNKDPSISAGLVQVTNGSVSTSGSYIQRDETDVSGKSHHILAKYSKFSKTPPVSCTIIGENCLDTDVWATIAMATDTKDALKLLEKNLISAIIIDKSGKSFLTHKALSHFQSK